ncbi:MAG: YoaK family protein [Candidatus Spyradocola sp.]
MEAKTAKTDRYYLMCERDWIFHILITVAGFFGAYTYLLRGGVFCNAQTGNVVLMGMALGAGNWMHALYYVIPISAYLLGSFLSELAPEALKSHFPFRWDTLLIAVEMLVVLALGFVPESAPVQISQVAINFIASMQYNTFRQSQGTPMATTFATNHIRQIGIGLAKEVQGLRTGSKAHREKLRKHFEMLVFFVLGAVIGTVLCNLFLGKALWFTLIPMAVVFGTLLHADLTIEKDMIERKPLGH